jgi:hypothetical protein
MWLVCLLLVLLLFVWLWGRCATKRCSGDGVRGAATAAGAAVFVAGHEATGGASSGPFNDACIGPTAEVMCGWPWRKCHGRRDRNGSSSRSSRDETVRGHLHALAADSSGATGATVSHQRGAGTRRFNRGRSGG